MSSDQQALFDSGPILIQTRWLYLAGNDNLVGKIGITTRIVKRIDEHTRAANMRHILSHKTPSAGEVERALKVQLRPWIISGTEWVDLSSTAPCAIIETEFQLIGKDTRAFREWLSPRYRRRHPA